MRGYDMLRAISELDDELVAEADGATKVSLSKFTRWRTYYIGSMAAGLVCVCLAGVAIYQIRMADSTTTETAELAAALDTTAEESIEEGIAENAVEGALIMEAGTESECDLPTEEMQTDAAVESWNEPVQGAVNDRWADYTVIAALTDTSGSTACYKAPDNGEYYSMIQLQAAIDQYEQYDGLYAYEICIDVFADGEQIEANSEIIGEQIEYLQSFGLDVWQNEDGGISGILTAKSITEFEGSADYGYALRFANEY